MVQSPSWEARRFSASQEIPEGSLPHSQVPATCPYPEPARSNPYTNIQLPEDPLLYHLTIYAWVSQVVCFYQISLPKSWIRLSSPQYALHVQPTPFFSILSPEKYWVSSTDH